MTRHTGEPMYLYRAYDSDGLLLYVGISNNVGRRMWEHKRNSQWYPHCADIQVAGPWDTDEALRLEARLIKRLKPVFNGGGSSTRYLIDRQPELLDAMRAALPRIPIPVGVKP